MILNFLFINILLIKILTKFFLINFLINILGAEINCEITSSDQWNFDISWCPKNPALFACSSFDGHVSIYSLVGGPQQVQTSNKIADSFPGMELYTQAPVPQSHSVPLELKRAPKWMRRPVRASFGVSILLSKTDSKLII